MSEISSLFIKDLPNCYYITIRASPFSFTVERNWSFIDHLSRALPTEKIFDLLQKTIRSESLIGHCPAELVFNMQKIIIKWPEVSYREGNLRL